MILEHAFITARECDDLLARLDDQLRRCGFARTGVLDPSKEARPCFRCGYDLQGLDVTLPCPECGAPGGQARRVEYARGKSSARAAIYRVDRQPQRVLVEFDRHRVNLAVSIDPYSKAKDIHRDVLLTIAQMLEASAGPAPDAEAIKASWIGLDARIRKANRRLRLPRDIALVVVLLLIVGIVVAVAVFG